MPDTEPISPRNDTMEQDIGTQHGPLKSAQQEVPERPALAPNVRLIGEMQGTGFTDRQWLIQRDGRFIQVAELLYRIAEQANGKRTLEEIAEGVTESTDWMVTADQVRQLIQTKLMPLRLILLAESPVTPHAERAGADGPRSLLAVNMRIKALSPRIIDPITRVLQILYFPPILISLLIATTAAHWWLYGVHGVMEGILDTLYTPGGLLYVLTIVILAGMFHEFGHASALRYGGGKVRGMGAGLYLIWPALYTDVTDSYRLGRWARVRTDLGGIYFHLIFTLGLIGLSIISGREFLLFAVLLINLQIIGQFIPFARFDGYWVLADLTGIPDFFSQMGPFLRSVLPIPGQGSKLPNLKTWVKAVFAIYIIVTIPLLAFLLARMVWRLPRFLAAAWDAFLIQIWMFPIALRDSDVLTMALLGTQVLLLALPVLATLYIIYRVSRIPIRITWNWSKPTAARRLAGALGCIAAIGLLGLVWAPQLRDLAGKRAILAPTDPRLVQAGEATAKLQTLQAELEGAIGSEHLTGTIVLKRPNLARIDIRIKGEDNFELLIFSDGKNLFTYFPDENEYTQLVPGPQGHHIRTFVAEPIVEDFFQPEAIGQSPVRGRTSYQGKETVDGAEYDVVEVVTPAPRRKTIRYFVSPQDSLIHRVVTTTPSKDGGTGTSWVSLKNIRTDEPVDESVFQWTPPSSARTLRLPDGMTLPPMGTPR